jgi:hypothetical protein
MPELALSTKPDADLSMRRWEAWWVGEIVDRPPVTLRLKPERPWSLPTKRHASVREAWLDVEFRVEQFAAVAEQQEWFADGLPILFPNLGPEVLASVFGAEIEYSEESGWSVPRSASCREIVGLEPDWDNPYWSAVERMISLSLEAGAGKWITGYTDMHTNADLLAALRDPQELCMECLDDPDAVREACEWVTPIALEAYERQVAPILAAGQPVATWLPAPAWGRQFVPNCDFNALIGPELFRELVLPSIHRETDAMDRNIFHLDGPSALPHLDVRARDPEPARLAVGVRRGARAGLPLDRCLSARPGPGAERAGDLRGPRGRQERHGRLAREGRLAGRRRRLRPGDRRGLSAGRRPLGGGLGVDQTTGGGCAAPSLPTGSALRRYRFRLRRAARLRPAAARPTVNGSGTVWAK